VTPVIGTVVFVIAFIALGLSVVLVALRGRGPGAGAPTTESRATRRAWGVGLGLLIAVIGIAIPALVLAADGDDAAKKAPHGVDLNASATRGRQLFAENCSTCHTLAASNAVGKVGPNLDAIHPPVGLVLNALEKGRARGAGQMPALLLQGQDAKDVAAYVAAVAGHNQ
jgi:mono/diheme cytochrome c family protein